MTHGLDLMQFLKWHYRWIGHKSVVDGYSFSNNCVQSCMCKLRIQLTYSVACLSILKELKSWSSYLRNTTVVTSKADAAGWSMMIKVSIHTTKWKRKVTVSHFFQVASPLSTWPLIPTLGNVSITCYHTALQTKRQWDLLQPGTPVEKQHLNLRPGEGFTRVWKHF